MLFMWGIVCCQLCYSRQFSKMQVVSNSINSRLVSVFFVCWLMLFWVNYCQLIIVSVGGLFGLRIIVIFMIDSDQVIIVSIVIVSVGVMEGNSSQFRYCQWLQFSEFSIMICCNSYFLFNIVVKIYSRNVFFFIVRVRFRLMLNWFIGGVKYGKQL